MEYTTIYARQLLLRTAGNLQSLSSHYSTLVGCVFSTVEISHIGVTVFALFIKLWRCQPGHAGFRVLISGPALLTLQHHSPHPQAPFVLPVEHGHRGGADPSAGRAGPGKVACMRSEPGAPLWEEAKRGPRRLTVGGAPIASPPPRNPDRGWSGAKPGGQSADKKVKGARTASEPRNYISTDSTFGARHRDHLGSCPTCTGVQCPVGGGNGAAVSAAQVRLSTRGSPHVLCRAPTATSAPHLLHRGDRTLSVVHKCWFRASALRMGPYGALCELLAATVATILGSLMAVRLRCLPSRWAPLSSHRGQDSQHSSKAPILGLSAQDGNLWRSLSASCGCGGHHVRFPLGGPATAHRPAGPCNGLLPQFCIAPWSSLPLCVGQSPRGGPHYGRMVRVRAGSPQLRGSVSYIASRLATAPPPDH
ncbi:hypothetical protein NDU88_003630 [Pleurodeles waltl]|uniref:Uncharacterized protein n=1 Tax=Pleurodeles waltl TaxID=8319 RepID=A0AAV7LM61_PLEWA|nr:hypothetical protein NDU88_003630 [Pleurodeles waltl]